MAKDDMQMPSGGEEVLIQLLTDFIKSNPSIVAMYFLFLIVICLQDIVMPHFSGKLVHAISNKKPLLVPFVVIIVIVLTIQVLNTITEWCDMKLFPNLQAFLRSNLLDRVFDTYRSNYTEIDVASILSKLIKIPYTFFGFIDQFRYYIFPRLLVYIIAIVYLSLYDLRIGMALLVVTIILIGAIAFSPKICEKASWATEHLTNTLANEMDDVFNNLVSVYSYNQEAYEKERLEVIHQEYYEKSKATIKCTFNIKILLFPVMFVFISYFMYRCYTLVREKKLDSGKFVSLFLMTFYITNSMWGLIGMIREVIPRWGRLKENINIFSTEGLSEKEETDVTNSLEQEKASSTPQSTHLQQIPVNSVQNSEGLVLSRIYYQYPASNTFILSNINFQVKKNETVALVGRIGSGKSTLLKLIMGYKQPTFGDIFLDGASYKFIDVQTLRKYIGYIHQYPILFNRTIYENIVYGLDAKQQQYYTKEKVYEILQAYGIGEIFSNQVQGLDTEVGRKGHKLSGGQRQVVWLLRVALMEPKLLILDEPTASVDDQTRTILFKMLDKIMQNRMVVIVTHDEKLMAKASRVIMLKDGNIIQAQPTWHP